jgi:hypothetical protein
MDTTTVVSVSDYLNAAYDGPDREYVDALLTERSVGEVDHSDV